MQCTLARPTIELFALMELVIGLQREEHSEKPTVAASQAELSMRVRMRACTCTRVDASVCAAKGKSCERAARCQKRCLLAVQDKTDTWDLCAGLTLVNAFSAGGSPRGPLPVGRDHIVNAVVNPIWQGKVAPASPSPETTL